MTIKFGTNKLVHRLFKGAVVLVVGGFYTGPALASSDLPDVLFSSFVDEFRFGVLYNDLHISRKREEGGVNINAEVLFRRPNIYYDNKFLLFALNPRPHIGGSFNTAGDTSQAYMGLTWEYRMSNKLFGEFAFGGAIHNGQLSKPAGRPATSLGCQVLMRGALSAGYEFTEKLRFMVTFAHIGGGGLCNSSGGLSTIGGRIGYKF